MNAKLNVKKVNWLFFVIILTHMFVVGIMYFFPEFIKVEGILSIVIGQLLILIPTLIFVFVNRIYIKDVLFFRAIRLSNVLLIILFVYLMIPLTSLINAISLTFAPNVVMDLSREMMDYPFVVTWFFIGFFGPISEELVFRGIVYEGYKKSLPPVKAMIFSALIFGLLHLNFNQMPYAFMLGILLVLLKEATGSMLAPILFHVIFNTNSVILMYLIPEDLTEQSLDLMQGSTNELGLTICILAILAFVTTTIGLCLLPFIARKEGRHDIFSLFWKKKKEKQISIWNFPMIFAVFFCVSFMIIQIYIN